MSVDITKLNEQFGIARVLEFKQLKSGLAYAEITGPVSSGRIYIQGAHVAAWQPKGFGPVIFMSRKSDFLPGKPIRGGVPLPFPWFAADTKMDRVDGMVHEGLFADDVVVDSVGGLHRAGCLSPDHEDQQPPARADC